eukprot:8730204-Pyramimonas_sp.AAC.1
MITKGYRNESGGEDAVIEGWQQDRSPTKICLLIWYPRAPSGRSHGGVRVSDSVACAHDGEYAPSAPHATGSRRG